MFTTVSYKELIVHFLVLTYKIKTLTIHKIQDTRATIKQLIKLKFILSQLIKILLSIRCYILN